MSCLKWNNKLSLDENLKVINTDKLDKKDFTKTCNICLSNHGMVIKCKEKCNYYFHVECARRSKLYMTLTNNKKKTCIYCPSHTPLSVKKNIELEEKRTRDDILKFIRSIKKYFNEKEIEYNPFKYEL